MVTRVQAANVQTERAVEQQTRSRSPHNAVHSPSYVNYCYSAVIALDEYCAKIVN